MITWTLSSDRKRVVCSGCRHETEFPVAELARWIRFYRRLRDRRGGRFREHYAADVAALEAVERELIAAGR